MPFIPVPNVVQLEMIYNWDGQTVENVLHYLGSVTADLSAMTELCGSHITWWNSTLRPLVASNMQLVNVRATDLTTITGPVVNESSGLPTAGTNASPSLPNNVALVLTKRTAQRGRSQRGRIYQGGLTENGVTANAVFPTYASDFVDAYEDRLTLDLPLADWQMVVVSRYSGGFPRETGQATIVTNITTDATIDSQRRRLPGRGA